MFYNLFINSMLELVIFPSPGHKSALARNILQLLGSASDNIGDKNLRRPDHKDELYFLKNKRFPKMTAHRTRHHLSHCHTMALVQCGVGINTTQHRTTPHYLDIVQQRNLETLLSAVLCGVSAAMVRHRTRWNDYISTT